MVENHQEIAPYRFSIIGLSAGGKTRTALHFVSICRQEVSCLKVEEVESGGRYFRAAADHPDEVFGLLTQGIYPEMIPDQRGILTPHGIYGHNIDHNSTNGLGATEMALDSRAELIEKWRSVVGRRHAVRRPLLVTEGREFLNRTAVGFLVVVPELQERGRILDIDDPNNRLTKRGKEIYFEQRDLGDSPLMQRSLRSRIPWKMIERTTGMTDQDLAWEMWNHTLRFHRNSRQCLVDSAMAHFENNQQIAREKFENRNG